MEPRLVLCTKEGKGGRSFGERLGPEPDYGPEGYESRPNGRRCSVWLMAIAGHNF